MTKRLLPVLAFWLSGFTTMLGIAMLMDGMWLGLLMFSNSVIMFGVGMRRYFLDAGDWK